MSDRELLRGFSLTGQNELATELYNRYRHLVFGVCLKYLKHVDDARDETASLFEKLLTSRPGADVENVPAWLHRVVRNHCLMVLRKRQRLEQYKPELGIEGHLTGFDDDVNESNEHADRMWKAIQLLSECQRRCLSLFYIGRKSYREIVEHTGMPEKQVKSNLQNAKRNLRIMLSK